MTSPIKVISIDMITDDDKISDSDLKRIEELYPHLSGVGRAAVKEHLHMKAIVADRDRTIEELRATISDFDNGHDKYALDAKTALLDRMTEALKLCKPCVEYSMNNPGDNDVGKFMNRHTLLLFTISELLTDYANQKKQ